MVFVFTRKRTRNCRVSSNFNILSFKLWFLIVLFYIIILHKRLLLFFCYLKFNIILFSLGERKKFHIIKCQRKCATHWAKCKCTNGALQMVAQ